MKINYNSRRQFIKSAALSFGAFSIVPINVLGKRHIPPSDKFNIGVIGTGAQGMGLSIGFNKLSETQMVAACDIDKVKYKRFLLEFEKSSNSGKNNNKNQLFFTDNYFDLLNRKDVDGVVVSTPDHWHAAMSIDAMRLGKHVYCEKPLSHTIKEGRAMVNASKKYDRVLQTGSMQRSSSNFLIGCQLVRNGYLGKISQALVNVGNPASVCKLPFEETPDSIDWDKWLGSAQLRPYNKALISTSFYPRWRWYKEFGGGILADWGAHMFDIVQWGLGMDDSGPVRFVPPQEPNAVKGLKMYYGNDIEVIHQDFCRGYGVRFIGSEGTMDVSRGFIDSKPENIVKSEFKNEDLKLYQSKNHLLDWVTSIKNGTEPICHAEIGHRSASVCHLSNIAYELREELHWDPINESFIDNEKANLMRSKIYRDPYSVYV